MKHYDGHASTQEEVEQIHSLADFKDKTVLEIGCGTGRITFPLAKHAKEVIAIDIDEDALREARSKDAKNITFLHENVETMQLGTFDMVISSWMGFMYVDTEKAVSNISQHTKDTFLLLSTDPKNEFHTLLSLLLGKESKPLEFYDTLETTLKKHFSVNLKEIETAITFRTKEEMIEKFRLELLHEHNVEMNHKQKEILEQYIDEKDTLMIDNSSIAYVCEK